MTWAIFWLWLLFNVLFSICHSISFFALTSLQSSVTWTSGSTRRLTCATSNGSRSSEEMTKRISLNCSIGEKFSYKPISNKEIFAALNMKDWPGDKPSIWQPIALKCLNSFRQWERMDNETPMYSIPVLEGNQLSFCGGSRVRAEGSFNLSLTAILWFLSYFLILIFKLSNVYIFSGLKNDSMSECFRLRHTVRGHFFPCRFIKIVPIQVSSISKSFFKLVKLLKSSM